jgi:NADPH:quinone reductase-like Zn-dependent oxidoreductase
MSRQWILEGQNGFETSLEYQEDVTLPSASELGPHEVLVTMHAASLNYREIMISSPEVNCCSIKWYHNCMLITWQAMSGPSKPGVIPGCDGAGEVEAVGTSVRSFRLGDRVITHITPSIVDSNGDDAYASMADCSLMLGQGTNGTLCSKGVFSETALVHAPRSLEWLPASTLTCTWATAWNILFGLQGREARPGTWILVQGTSGVSVATLQLAVAAGATVVVTTSTEEKGARLKTLGASHTVNYRSNADNWGLEARTLTPNGRGFDIVVDVGGNETLPQSLAAVRVDGSVLVIGAVGEMAEPVPLFAALFHTCVVRGILGGSRAQLQKVAQYIDDQGIKPAIDDVVFELAEAKDAYRRLKEKKHFSKVVIRIDH